MTLFVQHTKCWHTTQQIENVKRNIYKQESERTVWKRKANYQMETQIYITLQATFNTSNPPFKKIKVSLNHMTT